MNRRTFLQTSAGAPLLAQASRERWNVILITCDQLRADTLACYGNPVIRTPAIDKLASEGVRFVNAFAQCPQCVPARTTLHTGRYPHTHRTPTNLYRMPDTEPTLARLLNAEGYKTACVGERPFAPRNYLGGFTEAIATGKDHAALLRQNGWSGPSVTPERRKLLDEHKRLHDTQFQASAVPWGLELDQNTFFTARAREFLRENRNTPFFLHVSYRRPHHPFDPPAPYDRMYVGSKFPESHARAGEFDNKPPMQKRALESTAGCDLRKMTSADLDRVKAFYYGMTSLCDHSIGELMQELDSTGLRDRTIVVLTADHGEMLGDHGLLFKGGYMYDQVLHVPLIIRAPGRMPAGIAPEGLVETADVVPTLSDLLGFKAPAVQGKSLLPLATDPKRKGKDAVFAEFPTAKMVRTTEWKLVHYTGARYGELYDLRKDPHEFENRYDDPSAAAAQKDLYRRLADWLIADDPAHAPVRDEA